ncbi:hypothetical protein TcYC6_0074610 [Trypanosoma cruzi]|nr:hypothetical protein TcYC6_0074610 [Trypanosoma cruzi]
MKSLATIRAIVEELAPKNPYTGLKDLPEIPRPEESSIPRELPSLQQIPYVQNVLNMLSYNFLPQTFFCLEKHRSLDSIMLTSKEILAEALPIRCLEATFVGLYLTHGMKGVDRIPLSFKSRARGKSFHHIVLVIRCDLLYGALGLSRRSTLMDKPMMYKSLFELIMEYKEQYEAIGHQLVDFKLGLCASHESHSRKAPCWRYIAVSFVKWNSPLHLTSPQPSDELPTSENSKASSEDGCAEEPSVLANVSNLLDRYSELLTTISAQYEKCTTPFLHGSTRESHPICLRDLHEMEETTARQENMRRLEAICSGRLPCLVFDVGTKKRAASRSTSKKRIETSSKTATATRTFAKKCTATATKKSSKKDIPADDQKETQHKQSQTEQKQELQQLPLVMEHTSSLFSSLALSGRLNNSTSVTQRSERSGLSPSKRHSLPFLENRSNEFGSLVSQNSDSWGIPFLPFDVNGVNFHDLL